MYERTNFLNAIRTVRSSSRILCAAFQRDLSALFDSELPEDAARRTMAHMEACEDCAEFFQAIRLQALAHKDLSVPGSLAQRLRRLRGEDLFEGMTDSEIVRRLATALYQLGKAYEVPLELSPLCVEIVKDGLKRYGPRVWSSMVVKRLEDDCGVDLRAPGFPEYLTDNESEQIGTEVIVRGRDQ